MMKQFRKNMMICLGIAALTASVLLAGCSTQKEADISDRQETKIGSEEAESSIAVPEATDYTEDTDVAESTESGENSENASEKLSLPVLDEIDSKVQIGTSGSSLIAVQAAVKLLEWGEHTGLDPEEIREAASAWISEQTDSDREEALLKLEMVDDAYQIVSVLGNCWILRDARIRRFSGGASLWSRLRQLCRQPDCERTKPLMLARIFNQRTPARA